jgi:hypothetical protein
MLLVALVSLALALGLSVRESQRLRDRLAQAEGRAAWAEAFAQWSRLERGGIGDTSQQSVKYRYWVARARISDRE